MSDLRERLINIIYLNFSCHTAKFVADKVLAMLRLSGIVDERTAVERERAAFVAGVRWTCGSQHTGDENFVDEAARRYPLPKEE